MDTNYTGDLTQYSIAEQRNKLLACCFANADVVMETDENGDIIFAHGALDYLGFTTYFRNGRNIKNIIGKKYAKSIKHLLDTPSDTRRERTIKLFIPQYGQISAKISCSKLKEFDNHLFVSLKIDQNSIRDEPESAKTRETPTLMAVESFSAHAAEKIQSTYEGGSPQELCLLKFDGLEKLANSSGQVEFRVLMDFAINHLLEISSEKKSVTAIQNDTFGVLHEAGTDIQNAKEIIIDEIQRN